MTAQLLDVVLSVNKRTLYHVIAGAASSNTSIRSKLLTLAVPVWRSSKHQARLKQRDIDALLENVISREIFPLLRSDGYRTVQF